MGLRDAAHGCGAFFFRHVQSFVACGLQIDGHKGGFRAEIAYYPCHGIGFLIPLGTAAVIFIFMRVPKFHAWGENLLRRFADRVFDRQETFNAVMLLDYIGSETIAQVTLRHIPEEYRGLTLAQTQLRADTGILVMLVEHHGGKTMPASAGTVFDIGDKLTVFGNYHTICKTFHAKEHFSDD